MLVHAHVLSNKCGYHACPRHARQITVALSVAHFLRKWRDCAQRQTTRSIDIESIGTLMGTCWRDAYNTDWLVSNIHRPAGGWDHMRWSMQAVQSVCNNRSVANGTPPSPPDASVQANASQPTRGPHGAVMQKKALGRCPRPRRRVPRTATGEYSARATQELLLHLPGIRRKIGRDAVTRSGDGRHAQHRPHLSLSGGMAGARFVNKACSAQSSKASRPSPGAGAPSALEREYSQRLASARHWAVEGVPQCASTTKCME